MKILGLLVVTPLIAIALEGWHYSDLVRNNCTFGTNYQRLLSFLLIILSFVTLTHTVNKMRNNNKSIMFVGFYYIIIDTIYVVLKVSEFAKCEFWDVFIREAVNTVTTYFLNVLIILTANHNYKPHLSILYWMFGVISLEIMLIWLLDHPIPSAILFNYFNVKVSIMVFEVSWDKSQEKFLFVESKATIYFLVYMFGKILKQIWYSLPYDIRHDRPEISIFFWVGCIIEIILLSILFLKNLLEWIKENYHLNDKMEGLLEKIIV